MGLAGCIVAAYFRWDTYKDQSGLFFAYNIPNFVIGFIAGILILSLCPFWCYHCGLAMSGQTTREDVRRRNELTIEFLFSFVFS